MSQQVSVHGVPVAKSKLISTPFCRRRLLLQEKVEPILEIDYEKLKNLPDWTSNLNDGFQIGFNKKNELVCYDFGHEDY